MLCISINQESRRLALADMVNAGRFGDMLEIRLDRFGKAPDVGELVAKTPKPLIMTCRRREDGGDWDGAEEERLAILRQCVISKADYVELELDIADSVRRYGPCKRVISYTNLRESPEDILNIFDLARAQNPDIVKLVTLARTPEEAWPLVQILAKSSMPTVIVGVGKANTMLALFGKKLGAPWIYAALERGMEAYPGQPTIDDLHAIYHVGEIQKSTRFLGIVGQGPRELALASCLNAAFASVGIGLRCLPLEIGNLKTFRKLIDIAKLAGVVIDANHEEAVLALEPALHGAAKTTKAVDLLVTKDDTLHGFHKGAKVWIDRLEAVLKSRFGGATPLKDRVVMLAGIGPSARLLAEQVKSEGGIAILASNQRAAAQQFAREMGCRHILFEAIYSTLHDVLVVCDWESDKGKKSSIHPGYLQPGIVVMDLTAAIAPTPLIRDAQSRSAAVVMPVDVFLDQALEFARMLTNHPIERDLLSRAIPARLLHDD